jgi:hypothetical protein
LGQWNDKLAFTCLPVGKADFQQISNQSQDALVEEIHGTLQEMFPDTVASPPVDSYT